MCKINCCQFQQNIFYFRYVINNFINWKTVFSSTILTRFLTDTLHCESYIISNVNRSRACSVTHTMCIGVLSGQTALGIFKSSLRLPVPYNRTDGLNCHPKHENAYGSHEPYKYTNKEHKRSMSSQRKVQSSLGG